MSEKSTRTYLDVFKHILSDGESVFPFSRASNEYDLSNLSNVKFRAGGVEHPVSKLELVAKEGPSRRWSQSWIRKAAARAVLRKAGLRSLTAANTNGTVTADAAFSNVIFQAPSGRFNAESLSAMTLAGALESIAAALDENPLSEWDDFAHWLGVERADFVNLMATQFDVAEVNGVEYPIPQSTGFSDFSGFARWIVTLLGTSASLSASAFWDAEQTKFVIPVTLKQNPVTVRRLNAQPTIDSTYSWGFSDEPQVFLGRKHGAESNFGIRYTDFGGFLDHPVLAIDTALCPTFEANYGADSAYASTGFNFIGYVYEATTAASIGQTVPAGWYAGNSATFALMPFDLTANPIEIALTDFFANDLTAFGPSFREMFQIVGTGNDRVFRLTEPVVPTGFVSFSPGLYFRLQTEGENRFINYNLIAPDTITLPMSMSRKGYARFGDRWQYITCVLAQTTFMGKTFQPGWYKGRMEGSTPVELDVFDIESCPVEYDLNLIESANTFIVKRPIIDASATVADTGSNKTVTFTFDI